MPMVVAHEVLCIGAIAFACDLGSVSPVGHEAAGLLSLIHQELLTIDSPQGLRTLRCWGDGQHQAGGDRPPSPHTESRRGSPHGARPSAGDGP